MIVSPVLLYYSHSLQLDGGIVVLITVVELYAAATYSGEASLREQGWLCSFWGDILSITSSSVGDVSIIFDRVAFSLPGVVFALLL